jgi:maltose alpha-D-glucosyltransferase/alpha-amylase
VGQRLVELIGETTFPTVRDEPYFLSLGPHGFYWFRFEQAAEVAPAISTGV